MMNKGKMFGIVVYYQFDLEEFSSNVNSYIKHLHHLVIWFNSRVSDDDLERFKSSMISSNYSIEIAEVNSGLSEPYNYALTLAEKKDCRFLVTMDQDSSFPDFGSYYHQAIRIFETNGSTFAVGPEINGTSSFPVEVVEVDHVISSGAIYDVEKLKRIGGFNDRFFIDALDEEVCYKAALNHFKTFKIKGCVLVHHFGEKKVHKLFGKEITTSNYSPTRYYYITRNHVWLLRNIYISLYLRKCIKHNYLYMPLVKVLLFEDCKVQKLCSIIKGFMDGYLSNCY